MDSRDIEKIDTEMGSEVAALHVGGQGPREEETELITTPSTSELMDQKGKSNWTAEMAAEITPPSNQSGTGTSAEASWDEVIDLLLDRDTGDEQQLASDYTSQLQQFASAVHYEPQVSATAEAYAQSLAFAKDQSGAMNSLQTPGPLIPPVGSLQPMNGTDNPNKRKWPPETFTHASHPNHQEQNSDQSRKQQIAPLIQPTPFQLAHHQPLSRPAMPQPSSYSYHHGQANSSGGYASPAAPSVGIPSTPLLQPIYLPAKPGFIPTWKKMLPRGYLAARKQREQMASRRKAYVLSVLNVSEFTISGVSPDGLSDPSSVKGLRNQIKQISREYGNAVFERDNESIDGGKWRIPLGAYQAFYTYLKSIPNTSVEGIPAQYLSVAMLGRQRLEKGYPSVKRLIHLGVPQKIANTLAPFQRGGVDFVHERNGRALIADEMGLGKTIQAIAALSMYHEEWPVVVLSPSGARYHWQNEFVNWLGEAKQDIPLLEFDDNRGKVEFEPDEGQDEEVCSGEPKPPMKPLLHSDVNVLTSGSDSIFPAPETKVVIISYGLAPKLVEDQIIRPGMFQCAIVDESHMLKNKSSKRTKLLLPVLRATKRCVLLSGTPALARPIELWPQMRILGTHEDEWLTNEDEFVRKYVKGGGQQARAELHTLLTGSVMIRRMKADILKQLPSKMREQGLVHVLDNAGREEFRKFLTALRQGKGALANLAFKSKEVGEEETSYAQERSQAQECTQLQESTKNQQPRSISHEEIAQKVNEEIQAYFDQKNAAIEHMFALQAASGQYTAQQLQMIKLQAQNALRSDIGVLYHQRTAELKRENAAITSTPQSSQQDNSGEQPSRKSLLIQMYKKTGQVKIPLVARMLREWINDPAKGKLCIFAHHISVLNEIGRLAGLSNSEGSKSNFIRIDGSTNPRQRQEQINTFQNNPAFRIALLGITAAGVAVTLTASSTVWFAELFWTPALLIQAEDRCHRIGQQARVRCLYIVAKGTLDEILWKHVEKKFRDLGEFVEGKEKMKIVVHKTYKNEKELLKSLEADEFDLDDEEYFDDDAEMKSAEKLESELHDDIEELEREELEMLKSTESDDDDAEGDSKPTAAETVDLSSEPAEVAGTSASEAICLSDDEDQQNAHKSLKEEGLKFDREFRDLKLYKMRFPGPSAGLDIIQFKGRVVVKGKKNAKLGPDSKPSIGDVVVACKDDEIVPDVKLGSLLMYFRNLMKSDGYLEFIFAEDEEFGAYFREKLESPDFMKELKNDEEENNSSKSSHDGQHNGSRRVRGLQTYHLTFQSQDEYGFGIDTLDDVLAVTTIFPSRVRKIGADSSPQVGDALVSINGTPLPARISAEQVRTALNALKRQGKTVELMFAAADMSLKSFVKEFLDQRQAVQLAERQASSTAAASRQKSADDEPEVIDLLDE